MGTGTGANATFAQLHYCACGAGELLEKEASQQDFLIFGQTALIIYLFIYFFCFILPWKYLIWGVKIYYNDI